MPVIRYVPPDPTDIVIQGEQMRAALSAVCCAPAPLSMFALLEGGVEESALNNPNLIGGEQTRPPMVEIVPPLRIPNPFSGTMIRNNSAICTPCGACYPFMIGEHLMDKVFYESTVKWVLTGVTRDGAGATLGNCRVVVFETGRIAMNGAPVVAETISDGSGNYSVSVPYNTTYEAIAYKPGSPDVAGITRNDIVASANG